MVLYSQLHRRKLKLKELPKMTNSEINFRTQKLFLKKILRFRLSTNYRPNRAFPHGREQLKPSAHSRFLSLRHAIFVFSCCRTQQTFIVLETFLKRSSVKHSSRAAWELYFLASHVVHDFCHETTHTADFCFWYLAIKYKYQICLISKLSFLRQKSLVLSYRIQQIF